MKKQGVLIYDDVIGRMAIRFGPLDYYGGLHSGERLEVLLDREWIPTRIDLGEFWYLKGVKLFRLNGLIVRIEDWYYVTTESRLFYYTKEGGADVEMLDEV